MWGDFISSLSLRERVRACPVLDTGVRVKTDRFSPLWIPAFAGMKVGKTCRTMQCASVTKTTQRRLGCEVAAHAVHAASGRC